MANLVKIFRPLVPQRAFTTASKYLFCLSRNSTCNGSIPEINLFKITESGNWSPGKIMPENVEELGNAQRTVANVDR